MTLVLRGISLNEEPLTRPLVGRFDERGGTVGRSDSATFTLPDPERMISRVQVQVAHGDQGYWIENVSTASPILHNGRPLSTGMRVMLHEGDELRIGGYTLQAAFEDDETSATILRGRTVLQRDSAPAEALARPPLIEPTPAAAGVAPRTPPPPARAASTMPPPDAQPVSPAPQAELSAEQLWSAFIEGAGTGASLVSPPSPELLRGIGAMMRIAVAGIHRLITMRAMAKDEMQAQMTVMKMRDNNPLKFAPDGLVALQLLLQPPARGFLPGPSALRDAVVDLQSHQAGVMAGMRAALEGVLDRFDPAKVETLRKTSSVLDALRPAQRRARLWDLYLEHYRELREEAQQDFARFFGEAFREAYEAQVRSLEAAHQAASSAGPLAPGRPR
jgi:predicted component of type VI protein secretion system